jgi:hypothetical protein
MSSPCPYAAATTGSCTKPEMNSTGGRITRSTRWKLPRLFGNRRTQNLRLPMLGGSPLDNAEVAMIRTHGGKDWPPRTSKRFEKNKLAEDTSNKSQKSESARGHTRYRRDVLAAVQNSLSTSAMLLSRP